MKYKVGDRVKIKSLDWYYANKAKNGYVNLLGYSFAPEMTQFCGEVVTIENISEHTEGPIVYHIEGTSYVFTNEMIEGLAEENVITNEPLFEIANIPLEKEMEWKLPDGYQFVDENGNIINATKIVLEKKKKEYPKTYEECAKELGYNQVIPKDHILGYMGTLLSTFQQLLICRDAYWKIAGEEMGLEKPWEPDWENSEEKRYCIVNIEGSINLPETILTKWILKVTNKILVFPTEEMRDAFYENFKELIEICKELL